MVSPIILVVDLDEDRVIPILVEDIGVEAEIEVIDIEDDEDEDGLELDDLARPENFPATLPVVLSEPATVHY